jgi:hypothetical protein
VQVSADVGNYPVWSRDGNRLYYVSAGGSITVATVRANGEALAVTKRERMPGTHGISLYDVAPGGNHIVFAQSSDAHKQIVVTTNWVSTLRTRAR